MNTHFQGRGFLSISTAIALILAAGPGTAQEVLVDDVGTATGAFSETGFVISGDGNTAFGRTGNQRIRWTDVGGFEAFSFGGEFAGLSFDGQVLAATETASNGRDRALRWTQAGGFEQLPFLTTGLDDADAFDISDDGTIIVGNSMADITTNFSTHAVRWTGNVVESLGTLDPGTNPLLGSVALAISGDGSTIVGTSGESTRSGWTAFRHTDAEGMVSLGRLNNGNNSYAQAVSNDGSVIVGFASDGALFNSARAYRWTAADGLAPLDAANTNYVASRANDVSADGSVVVGILGTGETTGPRAFRWTSATDAMTIENWLRAEGATIAADTTREAVGVSADGNVVVGETQSGQMFIARASGGGSNPDPDPNPNPDPDPNPNPDPDPNPNPNPNPNPAPGMITVADLNQSLVANGTSNAGTLTNLGVILNGAGSRPLDRRTAAGNSIFWTTGDLGQDQHSTRDGRFGVAELGFGRNFGTVQVNGVLGFNRSDYDTFLGGSTALDATYVKLETIHELQSGSSGSLWLVLGGVLLHGDADITRNYLVGGGAVDSSTGSTSIEGYGLRARLQWEQLYDQVHFSPYGELSHARACLGAYTETGGAFPTSYGELCEDSTELRVGFDAAVPTSDTFRLIGSLEGVHRFQERGSNITGQVTGLGGFNIAQAAYEQNWLRAGAGFEADLAGSTLSVMANATTQGEASNAWLSVNWRMEF